MEHWMTLLDNLRLINDRTGLGITQAKIIFMWSMVRRPVPSSSRTPPMAMRLNHM
jgi:hypothetical protein